MPFAVVDLLEPVHVDEREDERPTRATRTLQLAPHLLEPEPARPRAGQLVRRRKPQVFRELAAMAEQPGALMRRLLAVGGRAATVVGRLRPIRCGARPVASGPRHDVFPTRPQVVLEVVETSQRVTPLRATITKQGSVVTLLGGSQPRRGTLVP